MLEDEDFLVGVACFDSFSFSFSLSFFFELEDPVVFLINRCLKPRIIFKRSYFSKTANNCPLAEQLLICQQDSYCSNIGAPPVLKLIPTALRLLANATCNCSNQSLFDSSVDKSFPLELVALLLLYADSQKTYTMLLYVMGHVSSYRV